VFQKSLVCRESYLNSSLLYSFYWLSMVNPMFHTFSVLLISPVLPIPDLPAPSSLSILSLSFADRVNVYGYGTADPVENELPIFTARCYASAVLAMALCLSVSVSVSVCHKSEFY